jgi:hypothetical protein
VSFLQDTSRYTFPPVRQVNQKNGRVYHVPHLNAVLPSITRVLGAKPKPGLIAWRQRVGREEAARVSAAATRKGTALHGISEAFLRNDDSLPDIDLLTQEMWQYLYPWLIEHVSCVYAQEQAVFSMRLGASGSFDLLADVDHVLSIVDFKTSNRPKTLDWIEDYFIQGTFYACAVYELTGAAPKQLVFPIVNPTGLQVFVSSPAAHFAALRERIEYFYDTLDTPLALTYN